MLLQFQLWVEIFELALAAPTPAPEAPTLLNLKFKNTTQKYYNCN
jgi:hypothetical protein